MANTYPKQMISSVENLSADVKNTMLKIHAITDSKERANERYIFNMARKQKGLKEIDFTACLNQMGVNAGKGNRTTKDYNALCASKGYTVF